MEVLKNHKKTLQRFDKCMYCKYCIYQYLQFTTHYINHNRTTQHHITVVVLLQSLICKILDHASRPRWWGRV